MTHVFLAAGDLAMDRDDYDESFAATREALRSAEVGNQLCRNRRAPAAGAPRGAGAARRRGGAGAGGVIGGHAHILKSCELIEGKPVFHSLCNFATDLRMDEEHAQSKSWNEIRGLAEEWEPDFGSLYNFPKASRLAMLARLEIAGGRVTATGLLPLTIGRDSVPRLAAPGSAEHADVVDYLDAVTREARLNARYRLGDSMVELVEAAA